MFPVYGVKCLSRKTVHNLVEKFSHVRSKVADDARPGAEVVETTVKIFLCSGFRLTGKAMGQVYQCWWRICREINVFFSRFEYNMFYVLFPFVTYLLTLPLIWNGRVIMNCILKLSKSKYFNNSTSSDVNIINYCGVRNIRTEESNSGTPTCKFEVSQY
jgi:hypothetical protein